MGKFFLFSRELFSSAKLYIDIYFSIAIFFNILPYFLTILHKYCDNITWFFGVFLSNTLIVSFPLC